MKTLILTSGSKRGPVTRNNVGGKSTPVLKTIAAGKTATGRERRVINAELGRRGAL